MVTRLGIGGRASFFTEPLPVTAPEAEPQARAAPGPLGLGPPPALRLTPYPGTFIMRAEVPARVSAGREEGGEGMEIHAKHAGGMTFLARGGSNHWVVMDSDPAVGGDDAGARPMELLLMGLAGCTGMDVISILRKKRVAVEGFEIRVHGDRREEHPKAFTNIEIEYIFIGRDLPRHHLERAVELSQEKYCGAAATLRAAATISHRITIREPEEAETEQVRA